MTAIKHDGEKPRLDLLDPDAMNGLAAVLTFGAKKYESWNWAKGFDWSRIQASTLRHLFAFMSGEDIDPESGLPHVDHLQCNTMFLSAHYHRNLGRDDRHKTVEKPSMPEELEYDGLVHYEVHDAEENGELIWNIVQDAIAAKKNGVLLVSSPGAKSRVKVKQSSSKKSRKTGKKPTSSSSRSRPRVGKKP